MSGPYPPAGYPQQPEQGGWPGDPRHGSQQHPPPYSQPARQWPNQQTYEFPSPAQPAPDQQRTHEFPALTYGGVTEQYGGWGEPPRKRRNRGRIVVAVLSILVIISGVTTAIVLLNQRQQTTANGSPAPAPSTAPTSPAATAPSTSSPGTGSANGATALSLATGDCVSATAAGAQYQVGHKTACGAAESDLLLAAVAPQLNTCAGNQYLRIQGASGVYCFTLDLKQGDCTDSNYLKSACPAAAFVVLKTEPGPSGSASCTDANGATRWVPVGRDPISVACIGPRKS